MHRPVPSAEIIDALTHIRDLFRKTKPSNAHEQRAFERREAATKDLLSNLPRVSEHPTLRTLLEVADFSSLTLEGVHRLFGYELAELRKHDLNLNCGRTHIFESYAFERDQLIDLPVRLAPRESFSIDAFLEDLVFEWQTDIPIRTLEEEGWEEPSAFYVRVGTEDSLGSSIPPGSIARVEPISGAERTLPNPRCIYLLQFADGYRCSHCVVTGGKLRPFSTGRTYFGREEFTYPGTVRIAGRIRMFALRLPARDYAVSKPLPQGPRGADLVLPWEHAARDKLLTAKHRRFKRTAEEGIVVEQFLNDMLHTKLSGRTERRYRRPTTSEPHVNSLIHLALSHLARYTDTMRAGGSWNSDREKFSLETLLEANSLEEVQSAHRSLRIPTPTDVWESRRNEFGGWPPLLSVEFPKLRQSADRIVRLARGDQINGLEPMLKSGSLLLLEELQAPPDSDSGWTNSGWTRPIYVLRRGLEISCGYLERNGDQFALLSSSRGAVRASFRVSDLSQLNRVVGVAVPV